MAHMNRGNPIKFDEAGNVILKKPQDEDIDLDPELMEEILAAGQAIKNSVDMVKEYERICESEDVKEVWCCQFCDSEWKSKVSRDRHEAWCKENPYRRTSYRKPMTEVKEKLKKPKKIKKKTPLKIITLKSVIKELKTFDKIFGLTDEQIAKYIRGLMK